MIINNLNHVLLIDDDVRLCNRLSSYLSHQGYLTSYALNTKEAREILEILFISVIIIDVMMPDEDGIKFSKQLKFSRPDISILMLSAKSSAEDRIKGLKAGVADYLTKPFEPEELLIRLDNIFKIKNASSRDIKNKNLPKELLIGKNKININKRILLRDDESKEYLTTKELAVLKVLYLSSGIVVDRPVLADMCKIRGSDRAVDAIIARIRKKLEPNRLKPIHLITSHGNGYSLHC